MSQINKIRDAVMALSRGDKDDAHVLMKEVMAAKSKRNVSEMFNADDEAEVDESMNAAKTQARAARRHQRAGKKDMKAKVKAGAAKEPVAEMNDTGSDSPVVKGSHDATHDDVTDAKGSVKKSGKIDHKEYTGDKPNVYTKKDAVDPKPVTD